jgi:hypothetical protein
VKGIPVATGRMISGAVVCGSLLAMSLTLPASAESPAATSHSRARIVQAASIQRPITARRTPASTGLISVLVQLADTNPVALMSLATAKHLTRAQRQSRLTASGPSTATASLVVARLRALGLKITNQNRFSVTATGPTAAVDAAFGTTEAPTTGGRAIRSTVGGAILPKNLSGLVNDVTTSAQGGPALRPLLIRGAGTQQPATAFVPAAGEVTGAIARRLYGAPAASGIVSSPKVTIATIQFSGWDATALSTFAAKQLSELTTDPVASHQYTPVSVNLASPTLPAGGGGDIEVALDQESLLATAPNAAQRAYFVPNGTTSDFLAGINAVASDAANADITPPITALSISWGACEAAYGAPAMASLDAAFQNLAAAGVTVFASSGDAGAFDCNGIKNSPVSAGTLAVDYPASSPWVIGVGGLNTTTDTPSSPSESVWWDGQGSGGGGGESIYEPRPSWQPSAAGHRRSVPDISLAADPNSGFFRVYTTDSAAYNCSWCGFGGTSLASPLAAATLADLQIGLGAQTSDQFGLISPALYGAQQMESALSVATSARGFRDIADKSTNGYYTAVVGYDQASGLGAPNWTNLAGWLMKGLTFATPAYSKSRQVPISAVSSPTNVAALGAGPAGFFVGMGLKPTSCLGSLATPSTSPPPFAATSRDGRQTVWLSYRAPDGSCVGGYKVTFVDTGAPTLSATAVLSTITGTTAVLRWRATDNPGGSGIATTDVSITRVGSANVVKYLPNTKTVALALPIVRGATYVLHVSARDLAGNAITRAISFTAPLTVRSFAFSSGWNVKYSPASIAGIRRGTAKAGATAAIAVSARQYSVLLTTCPTCGRAGVYVDGVLRAVVTTYSPTTRYVVGLYTTSFRVAGRHTIVVRALGTRVPASRGVDILLEGLTAIK